MPARRAAFRFRNSHHENNSLFSSNERGPPDLIKGGEPEAKAKRPSNREGFKEAFAVKSYRVGKPLVRAR